METFVSIPEIVFFARETGRPPKKRRAAAFPALASEYIVLRKREAEGKDAPMTG